MLKKLSTPLELVELLVLFGTWLCCVLLLCCELVAGIVGVVGVEAGGAGVGGICTVKLKLPALIPPTNQDSCHEPTWSLVIVPDVE